MYILNKLGDEKNKRNHNKYTKYVPIYAKEYKRCNDVVIVLPGEIVLWYLWN